MMRLPPAIKVLYYKFMHIINVYINLLILTISCNPTKGRFVAQHKKCARPAAANSVVDGKVYHE